jgi:hypothetical protein
MGEKHAFDWLTFLLAGFASAGAVYGMEKLGGARVPRGSCPRWCSRSACSAGWPPSLCRPPQSSHVAHRSGVDEAQDLLAFGLWRERLPHRRLGAAVSSAAHVPNRFRLECLSIRPLPARAVRRRPEHEGICHPGASPLRLPPHSHRERNLTSLSMALCATLSPATPSILIICILFFHGASARWSSPA